MASLLCWSGQALLPFCAQPTSASAPEKPATDCAARKAEQQIRRRTRRSASRTETVGASSMRRRVNQHARIRPSLQVKRGEERWCNAFLHNVRLLTSMEHTMNNQNRSQARISALALSVAITLAAVIGLTDASERQCSAHFDQRQCAVRCAERRSRIDAYRPRQRTPRLKFQLQRIYFP